MCAGKPNGASRPRRTELNRRIIRISCRPGDCGEGCVFLPLPQPRVSCSRATNAALFRAVKCFEIDEKHFFRDFKVDFHTPRRVPGHLPAEKSEKKSSGKSRSPLFSPSDPQWGSGVRRENGRRLRQRSHNATVFPPPLLAFDGAPSPERSVYTTKHDGFNNNNRQQ